MYRIDAHRFGLKESICSRGPIDGTKSVQNSPVPLMRFIENVDTAIGWVEANRPELIENTLPAAKQPERPSCRPNPHKQGSCRGGPQGRSRL